MSANFTPTPHYLDKCTFPIPIFPDTCVKRSVLSSIAATVPGQTIEAELERILYALIMYPLSAHELREFLGCDQPEKSFQQFVEITGCMEKFRDVIGRDRPEKNIQEWFDKTKNLATVFFFVTDKNGNEHQIDAYTLQPEKAIGWEVFGRSMKPTELSRALRNAKKCAAQAAKGEGKA